MTAKDALQKLKGDFKLSPFDAEILLSLVIKKPREFILSRPEYKLNPPMLRKVICLGKRRNRKEPLAYIVGNKEFFGLKFLVDKNVLIPRPETEILVEKALDQIYAMRNLSEKITVIDVGTGSGNILVSIAKNLERLAQDNLFFFGIDISKKALRIARKNAGIHNLSSKLTFFESDLLKSILKNNSPDKSAEKLHHILFDSMNNDVKNQLIITANLPYVSPGIYRKYRDNLRLEPKIALTSASNGLSHYSHLIREVKKLQIYGTHLGIQIFLEISPEQKKGISLIIRKYFPKAETKVFKDLAGRSRAVRAILA